MSFDIRRWQAGPPWQVLGDSSLTNGEFLFGEARLDPGTPTPGLHVHEHEDESMYVVEGVLTVELGGDRTELHPGDFMVLPRAVPHRFANLHEEPVRAVGVVAPTAIEGYFAEQAAYFATLDGPPDPDRIAEMAAPYGITIIGPPLSRADLEPAGAEGEGR
ncbi:MAG: cupin domain-containing protein [Actinobacteria bacterium]|nr:cupin domain-containing protein [Actinomycetota bacterium]